MPDIGLLQGGPSRRAPMPPPAPIPVAAERADDPPHLVADTAFATRSERFGISLAPRDQTTAHVSAVAPPPIAQRTAAATAADPPPSAGAPASVIAPPLRVASTLPPIRARDLLLLLFGLLVIVGTGLGIRDPWPADEPRFAALARDMALSHEWLFPRVGGDLYQDKPPLYFWLLAICYSLFGSVRASFLIPSFLAAGGILFLIYDLGRRLATREAGVAAALAVLCSLQFVLAARGAQIDTTLCFLTTLSLYALLRHLLLGPAWGWYALGGFAAGLGIFTKGVGFLPMLSLLPFFLLRGFRWKGLAPIDAGALGWRWWLAPLAMLVAVSLWFVPMLLTVAASGSPEYAAYRDELMFKQTVGRYAAAWHHVKGWYYFLVEVIPPLWLPWSLLLFWLVPRFRSALRERDARVWLPLSWVFIVVLFFSMSPGKRGIYILPALPALAIATLPFLDAVLARSGVRRAGFILGASFFLAALVLAIAHAAGVKFAVDALAAANLSSATALYVYVVLCGAGLAFAWLRAPLVAWPAALGALTIVFSYFIAPAMNPERSGGAFVRSMLTQVKPDEALGLVAYKEQFLLYLDRPTVNFGHRRWLEGPQETYDAAAWLNAEPDRVLLVPRSLLAPCFVENATNVGKSSGDDWYLVRAPAIANCSVTGDAARAIQYAR